MVSQLLQEQQSGEDVKAALAYAAGKGHRDIVALMLKHNASPLEIIHVVSVIIRRLQEKGQTNEIMNYRAIQSLLCEFFDSMRQDRMSYWSMLPQDLVRLLVNYL